MEAYGGTGIYARHTGNGFSKTYIGAAGIGGGYKCNGGTVAINGGRVMVEIGFSDSRYIGHGGDVADNGTLTLAPGIKVHYYPYCSPVASSSRVSTCQGRCDTWGSDRPEYKDLVIETCDHPDGLTYTINDTHHTSHCKYCLYSLTEEHHIPQVTNVCDECGYGEFADGTLTLDFSDNLSGIDAGVPYIVKWESGADNVSSPQFQGVTLSARNIPITFDNIVSFQGIYSTMNTKDEYNTSGANNTILYLGSDDVLYYPIEEMEINAFHAYFLLLGDLVCGEPTPTDTSVNASVLHFGDKNSSGIIAIDHPTSHNHHSGWYELSGRRLSGKPKAKGLYIKDGKKVIVK